MKDGEAGVREIISEIVLGKERGMGSNLLSRVIIKMTICCFEMMGGIWSFFSFISLLFKRGEKRIGGKRGRAKRK